MLVVLGVCAGQEIKEMAMEKQVGLEKKVVLVGGWKWTGDLKQVESSQQVSYSTRLWSTHPPEYYLAF